MITLHSYVAPFTRSPPPHLTSPPLHSPPLLSPSLPSISPPIPIGVSGDRIEVEPVGHSKSFFPRSSKSQKPVNTNSQSSPQHRLPSLFHFQMTYEVKKVCACELLDERNASRRVFRIIRLAKDGSYKNVDFEAPQATASMCGCGMGGRGI